MEGEGQEDLGALLKEAEKMAATSTFDSDLLWNGPNRKRFDKIGQAILAYEVSNPTPSQLYARFAYAQQRWDHALEDERSAMSLGYRFWRFVELSLIVLIAFVLVPNEAQTARCSGGGAIWQTLWFAGLIYASWRPVVALALFSIGKVDAAQKTWAVVLELLRRKFVQTPTLTCLIWLVLPFGTYQALVRYDYFPVAFADAGKTASAYDRLSGALVYARRSCPP